MEKYKIMGDCELSLLFADELKGYFRPVLEHSVLVPIPITEQSQAARGFNQVELLLESAGLPYVKALNNVGEGEKQARKNRRERLRMTQPFTLEYPAVSRLEGASVILVDDLYTTGRTLFHAADALKSALPGRIQTFSLFR
ncbi:ComF family protein [Alkalibacterium subtropicum]|nr:phosphoribosyltransferase family protein [Alkalibacterium subtropicum]